MPRPCDCDRCCPDGGCPYTLDQCRRCWLYRHDPAYRAQCDAAPPGPLARAAAFAGAALRHAAGGLKSVPEEEYARRLALCLACPRFDAPANRCLECGCAVAGAVAAKARWASESCPLGKW